MTCPTLVCDVLLSQHEACWAPTVDLIWVIAAVREFLYSRAPGRAEDAQQDDEVSPDSRARKLARLKEAAKRGEYKVAASEIAEKIIDRMLRE